MILGAALVLAALVPAAPSLDDCDARLRAERATFESYRCFWLAGRREKRLDDAAARLEAYRSARPDDGGVLLYLGLVEADRGAPRALDLFLRAVDAFVARGERKGEVYARISAVYALRHRGRLDEAAAQLDAAERAAETSGLAELRVRVLAERGAEALRREDYGLAYARFRSARASLADGMPPDLPGRILSGLGVAAWRTGRAVESAAAFRAEAAERRRAGDRYDEAMARANLMQQGLGWLPVAEKLRRVRETLAFARSAGNARAEAMALRQLANFSPEPERLPLYEELLSLSLRNGDPDEVIAARRLLGWELARSRPDERERGFALLEEARKQARRSGRRLEAVSCLTAKAELLWDEGRRERALATWASAMDAFESVRELQPDATTRRRVASRGRWVYEEPALRLLARGAGTTEADAEAAFAAIERMRAAPLRDEVRKAPDEPAYRAWRDALGAIAEAQRPLADSRLTDDERDAILVKVEAAEARELEARQRWARAAPRSSGTGGSRLVTTDEVRAALGPRRAMLLFVLPLDHDDRPGSLLCVTDDGVRVDTLGEATGALREAVGLFASVVGRGDGSEGAGAARLYEALIARAVADLPARVDELVIVPDGVLYDLPFDLLRPERAAPTLGDRFDVEIAPSASAWLACSRRKRQGSGERVLVLADPVPPAAGDGPAAQDRAALGALRVGSLPYARREAAAIGRAARGAVIREGTAASERFVKSADMAPFAILHLAAHALVDPTRPDRSAILLTPGGRDEDGLLQAREIPALRLGGKLVVLSACGSATGEILSTDVLGLSDAFFRAGARAVLGTLWPVRDDAMASFVEAFYRSLSRGATAAQALALAKRERERAGDPPRAWAAFVLVGDGDWAPLPYRARSDGSGSAAAVLCVLLALGAARWRPWSSRPSA